MLHGLSGTQAALRPALPGTACHRQTLQPLLTLTLHVFVQEATATGHGEPRLPFLPGPAGALTASSQHPGVSQHPLELRMLVSDGDSNNNIIVISKRSRCSNVMRLKQITQRLHFLCLDF